MISLDGSSLTLEALARIADDFEPVDLTPAAVARVGAARTLVEDMASGEAPVYGVNTGFGLFADVRIPADSLDKLQVNLLRSHAAGVDAPLPIRTVRATLALRANVLAKGYSGIRLETLQALLALLNHRIHPHIPCRGSVGASGDLAPLAHLALVLIGEGTVLDGSSVKPAADALRAAGLSPVALRTKEGIALINGTQPSLAVLGMALLDAERLARAADIATGLSLDALKGSFKPFEARVHEVRPHAGQVASAANLAALTVGSAINKSHEHCGRVQDAYSLRCAPQVHGAVREGFGLVRKIAEVEANAATDNPMVFAETGEIVSAGNFHGAPLALAADLMAIGLAQLATISERRSERLVNPALSDLPAFLTRNGGIESGFMLVQVTAAALASELKVLAHPASVDTIPTSANKEDHVSMSMSAALKAERAVFLARRVLAIEMLCACQALDLLAPLTTSAPLARVHRRIRESVATLDEDRQQTPDIEALAELIATGAIERACGIEVN